MSRCALRKLPASGDFGPAREKNLSRAGGIMNSIKIRKTADCKTALRRTAAGFFALLLGLTTGSDTQAQTNPNQQCSLAAVSRLVGQDTNVCDTKVVQHLAEQGQAFAQNQMGISSVLVIGPDYIAPDPIGPDHAAQKALAWFQKAAQQGYAPAQVNLAVMHINGWGTPVNYGAALHWLHAAADQHFGRAYYNLGVLYLDGKGVRPDNDEAFYWFQRGAAAGDSSAQANLGYFYDQGMGCKRNLELAVMWYRKAADAGNPFGENNLADLYLRGEGIRQDDSAAFSWFQKAADQGETGARIKLGYMYAEGRGTKKDPEAAYAWIAAATAAGDPRGKELLHSLEQVLSAKQIAGASARAQEWIPRQGQLSAKGFVP
jgi:uncharacterized protein